MRESRPPRAGACILNYHIRPLQGRETDYHVISRNIRPPSVSEDHQSDCTLQGLPFAWNTAPGIINLAGGGSFRPVVFESERDFMPELPRRKGLTYPKPHRHCFPKTIFLAHEPFITSKESFNLKYSFHLIWNYWGIRHQNLILMGKYLRHCAKEIFSQTNYSKLVFL
jgi:hypothetical protein